MPRNDDDDKGPWTTIIIVALVLIILILLYPTIIQAIPVLTNPLINVSGNVKVSGFSAVPEHVTFIGSGQPSTVAIGSNGSYEIMLQNGHAYNTTIEWSAAGGLQSGNCSAGSLDLHLTKPEFEYNISC